jgi:hypothetical protein
MGINAAPIKKFWLTFYLVVYAIFFLAPFHSRNFLSKFSFNPMNYEYWGIIYLLCELGVSSDVSGRSS